jgi:Endosomal/lysosomal potassium channel TMEM175
MKISLHRCAPTERRIVEQRATAVLHARRTTERLSAFSDGVFAVLITVLVLDLMGCP